MSEDLIKMTAEIVSAYVAHNSLPADDLPGLLNGVYASVARLAQPVVAATPQVPAEPLVPAVPIRKSVTDEYIICLDDGLKFQSLKRHLTGLGMTPATYRAKWDLPKDYPMVAPAYAKKRSDLAKSLGLGRLTAEGKIARVSNGRAN